MCQCYTDVPHSCSNIDPKLSQSEIRCYDRYTVYNSKKFESYTTVQISDLRERWSWTLPSTEEAFPSFDWMPYSTSIESHPSPDSKIVSLDESYTVEDQEEVRDIFDYLVEAEESSVDEEITIMKEALLMNRRKDLRKKLDLRIVETLSKGEGEILSLFLEGLSQSDMAKRLGTSRAYISKTFKIVTNKLTKELPGELS
jgi:DNA-binding CsgD family transcriptional regulator